MSAFSQTFSVEAIILNRKKGQTSSIISYITPEGILKHCTVENRRLNSMKNGGYLQPFSRVYLTLADKKDYARIRQVDGNSILQSVITDFDAIAYISFISELSYKLFKHSDVNKGLYVRLKSFSNSLMQKSIPLASVIIGWQLLQEAGFLPKGRAFSNGRDELKYEIAKATNRNISDDFILGIQKCLEYSWEKESILEMPKIVWQELETLIYLFAQFQIGESLETVSFIKNMKCTMFKD